MAGIPSYSDWMNNTNAGAFHRRGSLLRDLDEKIKQRRDIPTIRAALKRYLQNESEDSALRNRTGMVDQLIKAVGLGPRDTGDDFDVIAYNGPVPDVKEPKPSLPESAPPPPRVDPRLEQEAQALNKVLTPRIIAGLQKWKGLHKTYHDRVGYKNSLMTKMASMSGDLKSLRSDIQHKLHSTQMELKEALEQGIDKFKERHRAQAADVEFKITMAKSVFEAIETLPFPLSVVGKVGKAVAGALTVDTQWTGYELTIPTPDTLKGKIQQASEAINRMRTMNIATSEIKNPESFKIHFLEIFNEHKKSILDEFEKAESSISDDARRSALAQKFFENLRAFESKTDLNIVSVARERLIGRLGDSIKQQFEPFLRMPRVDIEKARAFVTLQLIADYAIYNVCKLEKGEHIKTMQASDLAAKGKELGKPFIDFLASKEAGFIIKFKEKSGTSVGIYAGGQIPWDESTNHAIAVMLFLEWFQRTINPFKLFHPQIDYDEFHKMISEYIRNLGLAMKRYETTEYGFKTTSSVESVHRDVSDAMTGRG